MANAIRAGGGLPEIVLGIGDSDVLDRIEKAGQPARQLASDKRYDAIEMLRGAACAVFDFSHIRTGEMADAAATMLNRVRDSGTRSLVIDTIGRDCLGAMQNLTVDILAIPYAGGEQQETLPGRDPAGLTVLFLASLDLVNTPLQLRIVVGPGFAGTLKSSIDRCAASLSHDVVLLDAPESLVEEIFAADLALSASGLTKYELAFAGTPCILVSIDEEHHAANRAFAELGSCWDAGLMRDVTPGELAALLEEIICDAGKRHDMAAAGRAAVDGEGLQRLLELLDD